MFVGIRFPEVDSEIAGFAREQTDIIIVVEGWQDPVSGFVVAESQADFQRGDLAGVLNDAFDEGATCGMSEMPFPFDGDLRERI